MLKKTAVEVKRASCSQIASPEFRIVLYLE